MAKWKTSRKDVTIGRRARHFATSARITNGAKDRCIRCVTLIDYSPPPSPPSLARRPSTVLVQDSRLPEGGEGGGLAAERRGEGGRLKPPASAAPVKSTWPDQSHSSSTRGYHRTFVLEVADETDLSLFNFHATQLLHRRFSPCQYILGKQSRAPASPGKLQ